jgi:integrase
MRSAAVICLGAGAGLVGAELAGARGTDVVARSGGVVDVGGRRPRAVPVLSRYQGRLVRSATFAGPGYLVGGTEASRHNVASALVASLAGGTDLPRLDQARLRATWLSELARALGLQAFMAATGVDCSQRLGDIVAGLPALGEAESVALLGGAS